MTARPNVSLAFIKTAEPGARNRIPPTHPARLLLPCLIAASILGCGSGRTDPPTPKPANTPWQPQTSGTEARLRGLCAVSADVAWVSGTNGTFGRTIDGGRTWSVGTVAGAEKLDLRDVEAVGADTAYALSAGEGDMSRIYKTTDAGKSWALQFQNADPKGFFDALAFWDERNGLALGDPVGGQFQLITTDDGGATWKPLPKDSLPPSLPNEGAFAASGTCLITHGDKDAWFATGGATVGRVFHSADRGKTWTVHGTPIAAGAATAGVFGIAFRDRENGMIIGGDYKKEDATGATAAVTADGGKTWTLTTTPLPFRTGVGWANGRWVAVGPSGSDASDDGGRTWKALDRERYNAVAFAPAGGGWAVGDNGRIAAYAR